MNIRTKNKTKKKMEKIVRKESSVWNCFDAYMTHPCLNGAALHMSLSNSLLFAVFVVQLLLMEPVYNLELIL